jgi:AcrR family transcriptional regulator
MGKGEETRLRIIEQVAPVFNQRGFAGASLSDVMAATGLEKGGIYRHFASKEELAAEAFRYTLAQNVKLRTAHLDELPTAMAKLRAVVEQFVTMPSAVPGGCPLVNTAVEADDTNEPLRALALEGIQDWRLRLMKLVEAGKKAGEFAGTVDARRVANAMIATLEGAQIISRLERNKTALKDAQLTLNAMLDSLAG